MPMKASNLKVDKWVVAEKQTKTAICPQKSPLSKSALGQLQVKAEVADYAAPTFSRTTIRRMIDRVAYSPTGRLLHQTL